MPERRLRQMRQYRSAEMQAPFVETAALSYWKAIAVNVASRLIAIAGLCVICWMNLLNTL